MAMKVGPGWTIREDDGIVTTQPAWICCLILSVSASGDYVEVYEGRDTTSGRKFCTLKALENRSVAFPIGEPVYFDGGIYLAFSTTGSECTIVWAPDDGMCEEEA